jgi:membrane-associated phospholipid phosphatase
MKPSGETFLVNVEAENAFPWTGNSEVASPHGLANWIAETSGACGPFERLTFAYLTWLNVIVLVCHRSIAHPLRHLLIQSTIALGLALLANASTKSQSRLLHFARHWYPLPLYIFFFEELQGLVHGIFPAWFDSRLITFDHSLFGVHPSVWLAQFANPALNDCMQSAYMTYFLYLVVLPIILYVKRDYISFWTVMLSTALAHYSVYVIAILFPVESPYFSLASLNTSRLNGGHATSLIELIEHFGRVHGAAFPSAHVAGSMVAILASWRYRRWLFWICLPFFISMSVATVYGRYHYAADVFAGLAVGTFGFLAGTKWMENRSAGPDRRRVQM